MKLHMLAILTGVRPANQPQAINILCHSLFGTFFSPISLSLCCRSLRSHQHLYFIFVRSNVKRDSRQTQQSTEKKAFIYFLANRFCVTTNATNNCVHWKWWAQWSRPKDMSSRDCVFHFLCVECENQNASDHHTHNNNGNGELKAEKCKKKPNKWPTNCQSDCAHLLVPFVFAFVLFFSCCVQSHFAMTNIRTNAHNSCIANDTWIHERYVSFYYAHIATFPFGAKCQKHVEYCLKANAFFSIFGFNARSNKCARRNVRFE